MENKSHQWFGATLSTSGKNGVIAVSRRTAILLVVDIEIHSISMVVDHHTLFILNNAGTVNTNEGPTHYSVMANAIDNCYRPN